MSKSTTTLSDEQCAQVEDLIIRYLETHSHLTNRLLRELSGIGYDQAIYFFKLMTAKRRLTKIGEAGGTRYLLAPSKKR